MVDRFIITADAGSRVRGNASVGSTVRCGISYTVDVFCWGILKSHIEDEAEGYLVRHQWADQ
jgi:hypothetical protein